MTLIACGSLVLGGCWLLVSGVLLLLLLLVGFAFEWRRVATVDGVVGARATQGFFGPYRTF